MQRQPTSGELMKLKKTIVTVAVLAASIGATLGAAAAHDSAGGGIWPKASATTSSVN